MLQGHKDKNIEDVDRFQLIFPLCEYHDKNWTWLDLALAIKQRCRRVLLQQVFKTFFISSFIFIICIYYNILSFLFHSYHFIIFIHNKNSVYETKIVEKSTNRSGTRVR